MDELQAAEDPTQRAWMIGHMPMGSGDVLHDGSNYFDQILNRYDATTAAMVSLLALRTFWRSR